MSRSAVPAAFADRIAAVPRVHDEPAAARLVEALGARYAALPEACRRLTFGVGGCSPFLSRLIARAPEEFAALLAERPEERLQRLVAATGHAGDAEDVAATMRALRRAKQDAALLIGLAEIAEVWTSLEAAAALTAFADAAAGAALRAGLRSLSGKGFRDAHQPRCEEISGVAVIAMGKMGAFELNYSSDIDLVIVYDGAAAALGPEPRVVAVAAAKLLVKILNDQTADGYVFRTDLRLRPDPGATPAAVSVRAAEAYYEAHGQNWERAAFIKARAAAGDRAVGEAFLAALRPFVWRKYLDFAAIEDIHSIKRQIRAAKGGERAEFMGRDIKTGRGGIREIEFLVQTQQLILGGKTPALRPRATLEALGALTAAGQMSEEARATLEAHYRYLRRVEHRLQMINDEQTHKIPRDAAGVERLAAFLGEENAAAFEVRLTRVLDETHHLFAELFEREERLSADTGNLVFTGVENDKATLETLSRMGFRRPADVSDIIRRWHTGSLRATRSPRARELLTKLAPRLLEALSRASDPDAAFIAFGDFLSRLPAGVQAFSLFANRPEIFDTLIRIMTIAPYLGQELSRRPHLIEAALESGWPGPSQDPDAFAGELEGLLARQGAFEGKLNAARRWGSEMNFEIAARLVLGDCGPDDAARLFTAAADALIAGLFPAAAEETARLHGRINGALAVIGLGRLGARAMTARSDIDLVFIYDAPEGAVSDGERPLDAATYYLRLVRRFITALSATTEEGALYEVDMQLRPSGAKGPWAVSFAAFRSYYEKDAWTWEVMALLKARLIAGDAGLCGRLAAEIAAILTRRRDRSALARDVAAMRDRLEAAKPASGPFDVKHGLGGLTDLDFALAFAALAAPADAPPPPGTRAMTEVLTAGGALAEGDARELLTASALFESVMQIGRAATGEGLRPHEAGSALKARLAAACGETTLEAAEEALKARRRAVRAIYERLVISSADGDDGLRGRGAERE